MIEDERPVDLPADVSAGVEDNGDLDPLAFDQWLPSLSFDGERVQITRPTDDMETIVMQPVKAPQPSGLKREINGTGDHENDGGVAGSQADDPGDAIRHDASPCIDDTMWLQMSKRTVIKTTDGATVDLEPSGSTELARLVEATTAGQIAEKTKARREARWQATVKRRERRLKTMIAVSVVVGVVSLVALVTSIS